MKDFVYYTTLFDVYGELLSEKQQNYFKKYYFHNLSLQEIAEIYGVSRNAIHKQLKESLVKLENYEKVLQIIKKNQQLESIILEVTDITLQRKLKSILEI